MTQIGQFTRIESGYSGAIRTLSLDAQIVLVPSDHGGAENAPDYRILLGDDEGPEIGAAWKRIGEKAGDYVSLLLPDAADPRQSVPIERRQGELDSALDPTPEAQRAGLTTCALHSRP
jgi:uncharacterized protein (DUF736 family)